MNSASATLTTHDGVSIDQFDLVVEREDPKNHKIKGSNNGAWGAGMSRGAMFPPSMNGPLGYINNPLPSKQSTPALFNGPKYNSQYYNGPAYNQPSFFAISGYTFDRTPQNQAPIGDSSSVLIIDPYLPMN